MAKRPVFVAKSTFPYYETHEVEFAYASGFALQQKQKSINALHKSFYQKYRIPVLEVSTKSTEVTGALLSAFNLTFLAEGKERNLECVFQGSKRFEQGGPFIDLYNVNPREAKKDPRLKESGKILEFIYEGEAFENEPMDYFYNWIYINAIFGKAEFLEAYEHYGAFTDIEFNPEKSLNCQAKALAIACGLKHAGKLEESLFGKESFKKIVYQIDQDENYEQLQLSLFDCLSSENMV